MLTDRQRTRCGEIAAALDRHDLAPWRKWEPSLGAEERGLIWDMRQHVIAAAARNQAGITNLKPQQNFAELQRGDDLDFWASDVEPDDDDDDGDVPCAACDGTGRDAAGNRCATCNGTGKAPLDDDDENEDGNDDE
jgi:hypothetical protein